MLEERHPEWWRAACLCTGARLSMGQENFCAQVRGFLWIRSISVHRCAALHGSRTCLCTGLRLCIGSGAERSILQKPCHLFNLRMRVSPSWGFNFVHGNCFKKAFYSFLGPLPAAWQEIALGRRFQLSGTTFGCPAGNSSRKEFSASWDDGAQAEFLHPPSPSPQEVKKCECTDNTCIFW